MTEPKISKQIDCDHMLSIVDSNQTNPATGLDLVKYRQAHPPVEVDIGRYLEANRRCLGEGDGQSLYAIHEKMVRNIGLRIVNLEEFFHKLHLNFNNLAIELNRLLVKEKSPSHFYFAFGMIGKSNFWISLLFVAYLRKLDSYSSIKNRVDLVVQLIKFITNYLNLKYMIKV